MCLNPKSLPYPPTDIQKPRNVAPHSRVHSHSDAESKIKLSSSTSELHVHSARTLPPDHLCPLLRATLSWPRGRTLPAPSRRRHCACACPRLEHSFSVFLSLKTDRELGAAVQECACSPLWLFWGCNPSGLGPDPHTFLYSLSLQPCSHYYVQERSISVLLKPQNQPNKAQSDCSGGPSRTRFSPPPLLSSPSVIPFLLRFPLPHSLPHPLASD